LLAFGISCLAAAGILIVLIVTGVWNPQDSNALGDPTPFGPTPNLTPEPTATATLPPGVDAPIASIVISKFGIDAPVQEKGVDANNVMESPDGPTNVAWYTFSGKPGFGSNAVFSGHVDYIDYGPAVFWHLKDLVAGDVIEVHLNEGTVYTYAVESLWSIPAAPTEDELRAVIGGTTSDVVTLITCGGNWIPDQQQYDQRTVIRARRVLEPPVVPVETPTL
jgi:LPXTG-site transpeptidase (sortase) family protein